MANKILLIDGHSILNRAFYGLPDLTNSEGLHTNAVYGFLNIMFRLIEEEQPDFLAVAFDVHAPTFRHEIFAEYKGTRKPMPEELRQQVPLLKQVLDAMKITRVEKAGLEADDILGTIAKKSQADGLEVRLVSGDRDLLQISDEHIQIIIPKTKMGGTEYERYYPSDVIKAYDVDPKQFIELKALMGDSADNIPGVPKVGEKTARGLMVEYGSIDKIYENIENITKKAIKQSLIEHRDLCDLSKVLATINIQADVDFDINDMDYKDMYNGEAHELFLRLGFKNLLSRFDQGITAPQNDSKAEVIVIDSKDKADEIFHKAYDYAHDNSDRFIGYYLLEDVVDPKLAYRYGNVKSVALAICFEENQCYFLPIGEGEEQEITLFNFNQQSDADGITDAYIGSKLEELSRDCRLATYDIKPSYRLYRPDRITDEDATRAGAFDILLGAYLINPLKSDYQPEDISIEYLQMPIRSAKEIFGKTKIAESELDLLHEYAGNIARVSYLAAPVIEKRLESIDELALFRSTEMPLSYILYSMEDAGIIVKPDELKAYGDKLGKRVAELETAIWDAAGENFNINSPKQLGEILFEKMGLQGGKKTKTGYSTAVDVLEKLAPENKIVADVLEYRGLAKLKSTYADGLAAYIAGDGRIHTSFNQTITATGRISSTEPNLQNIPMRTELGRLIRKVFIPQHGYLFLDADYSQVELRILAHMSKDEGLIEAYNSGKDIHTATAAKVFHVPFEEVTSLQRRNAKAVNFGIVYGISAFGLANDLGISRSEAKEYMESYIATYPGVKQYQDLAVELAKETGYSITLYKRRRPIPELKAGNFMQKQFGERVAMNAPIQGTAADIMKFAMIHVYNKMQEAGLKSKLILQIHDELLIETAPDEKEAVQKILVEQMESAAKLLVPLEADCASGNDWFEAK